jgi:hypothetical protein
LACRVFLLRIVPALFSGFALIVASALAVPAETASPVSDSAATSAISPAQKTPAESAVSYTAQCAPATAPYGVTCAALRRTNVTRRLGMLRANASSPAPAGYGPAQLWSAYDLATAAAEDGAGQTVALIDAYDYPSAEADLAVYRSQYGLPACTTANQCFTKVNEDGAASPLPAPAPPDNDWTLEEALDMDMVSAICPNCRILLVEASAPAIGDLGPAVDAAVALGARYVSNSYYTYGSAADTKFDAYYDHPGVAMTVASGDAGYWVEYPAASPYVTAVGGTSLVPASNPRGWSESAWTGAGSGCASFEPKPSWQADTGCGNRTVTDVSAVADPATGVAVYDSFNGENGWNVVGGTSVATPIIASVYALAGTPATGSNPASFPYLRWEDLNDVTAGPTSTACGTANFATYYLCNAGPGYDGPTGLGTPNGITAFLGPPDTITVAKPPPGRLNTPQNTATGLQVQATDSAPGQALFYYARGLPPGLTIDRATGSITGTPTSAGPYTVTVIVTDDAGSFGSATFDWGVSYPDGANAVSVVWPNGTILNDPQGYETAFQIQALDSDSGQPLTYWASGLPPGLSIDPVTGMISGIPAADGSFTVSAGATDTTGATSSVGFNWTVYGPDQLQVTNIKNGLNGTVGTPLTFQVKATDTNQDAALTFTASGLPAGLTIDPVTGLISGTPTTAGPENVYFQVTDATGASSPSVGTTYTITAPGAGNTVTVGSPGDQNGALGTSASLLIQGTDSAPGQTLSYSATGLPPGMYLGTTYDGSGAEEGSSIVGTPTAVGSYPISVTATDTLGYTASTTFTWTITGDCTAAQLLCNSGFETGSPGPWTMTGGALLNNLPLEPPHSGTFDVWLGGSGTSESDSLAQTVTIPASATTADFSFWLHIDTAETTTVTACDVLWVQVLGPSGTPLETLAAYSNLDAAAGYGWHSFSLAQYIGQTVTLRFTSVEDSSLPTSFVIDDTALDVS